MKRTTKKAALENLRKLKDDYRELIRNRYEIKAKNCATCDAQGSCCTDAHFVNVHITRLEAEAIVETLSKLDARLRERVIKRNREALRRSGLDAADSYSATYSCPLFEKSIGCLVHKESKPLPCIHHACYEAREDLPPDELLEEREVEVQSLNSRAYGNAWNWMPIPLWLRELTE